MELSPQQDVYYIDTVSPIDYFIDTVTPSAIQLNKEKTMSIELDGPLYLGSNSLQQQVDQNTEDITELQSDVSSIEGDIGSLDNLATSDKSSLVNAINETLSVLDPTQTADYIKNSKGLESGEISTNASILPWVEDMSHSTFDRSKFTVNGSPTITNDGIASGFSNSNYITFSKELSLSLSTPFVINSPVFEYTANPSAEAIIYQHLGGTNVFVVISVTATGKLKGVVKNTNDVFRNDLTTLTANTKYQARYISDGTTLSFQYKEVNETSWTTIATSTTSFDITINNIFIGGAGTNAFTSGSIDLKQFSITVDGVEVFNGNRTGIDTIKPDDYTVVGTPTITADGIASGFSSSNYINTGKSLTGATWEMYLVFNSGSTFDNNDKDRLIGDPSSFGFVLGCLSDGKLAVWISSNGTSYNITPMSRSSKVLEINTSYLIKCYFTGTQYKVDVLLNNTWDNYITVNSTLQVYNNAVVIIGTDLNGYDLSTGSIDLNSFKIYVDGDLVYQPCLKIPFTLSKTGAKIVDSIYRDRVTDMYEQFGYAPYYTLDTTNSNYTIPKGEVYGMVNKLVPTLVAPDYSKPVSLTYSSGLVMENDGWLEVQIQSSEATANPYVSINGSIICRTSVNSNGDLNRDTAMMVVRKGDIITSGGYSADTAIVLTYYPFKV